MRAQPKKEEKKKKKTVLSPQQNPEECTEIFFIPPVPTCAWPPIATSSTRETIATRHDHLKRAGFCFGVFFFFLSSFLFFLAVLTVCGNSWARGRTQAIAVTMRDLN